MRSIASRRMVQFVARLGLRKHPSRPLRGAHDEVCGGLLSAGARRGTKWALDIFRAGV